MCLLELDTLEDWPENLKLPKSRHFVLFLALDAKGIADDDVTAFAGKLLDQGMVYLSSWGRDAERVHDLAEEASADWNPDSDADDAVLSEWHEGEPLSEALWFSVGSAVPANDFENSCAVTLVASIGNPDWAEQLREWLEDPEALEKAREEKETLPATSGAKADDEEDADDADEDEEDDDDEEEEEDEEGDEEEDDDDEGDEGDEGDD
jgi:ribosomal protein L12E/L44/L45/RPP1/RPP2